MNFSSRISKSNLFFLPIITPRYRKELLRAIFLASSFQCKISSLLVSRIKNGPYTEEELGGRQGLIFIELYDPIHEFRVYYRHSMLSRVLCWKFRCFANVIINEMETKEMELCALMEKLCIKTHAQKLYVSR